MIAIIDYGMGNLRSVQKALEKVGAEAVITQDPQVIADAAKVVLPGVGAMAPAMAKLGDLGLIGAIKKSIADGKPFLGICLGLQLLFEKSDEGGAVEGLRILEGTVERFQKLKVPHMGWNQLAIQQPQSPMFRGIAPGADVYFCHSYHVRPRNPRVIGTTTDYGVDFVSSVCRNNLWGVQFHPEKSQTVGLAILKNFNEVRT
jgi:glutamine amidotransferase